MGRTVIACYKPKPGKNEALRTLMKDHLAIGLVGVWSVCAVSNGGQLCGQID
jgi:hypothetical protein